MKRIKLLKPALSRLLFFIIFFLPVISFQNIIEEINNNLDFEEINLFFRKEVHELNGALLGRISGKIQLKGNIIELYLIYKETVRIVGYDGHHPYEIIDAKKVTDFEMDKVPYEIDIQSFINPVGILSKHENKIKNHSIVFYPKSIAVDSSEVFFTGMLTDSVYVFRKNIILTKTIFKKYKNKFPTDIETYDYEKSTFEKVIHYKVNYKLKNHIFPNNNK